MFNETIRKENIVYVYTTCSNKKTAKGLGISAIKEKLAISMDYWSTNSIYPWGGVIKEANQFILMFSTKKILSKDLIKHIESKHPYLIPVITRSDISLLNTKYHHWINNFFTNKNKYLTEEEIKIQKKKEKELSLKLK